MIAHLTIAIILICALWAQPAISKETTPPPAKPATVSTLLMDLLDLSRPDLAQVRARAEAGDHPGALRQYRTFLAGRMVKLPAQKGHSYWLHSPADADRLLEGELITARYGNDKVHYTVPIGKPGQINFFKELPEYREIARDISTMQWVNKYCEAYAKTKDVKYLQAWCKTWADYLAHWDAQWAAVKANPAIWGKGPKRDGKIWGIEWAGGQTLYTGWRSSTMRTGVIAMLQLASANGNLEQLDPEVLGGLLVRLCTVEMANARNSLKGAEKGVPNQVRGLAEEVLNCGLTFTEFRNSKVWREESVPVCCLTSQPDGTSREQSLGYFINYFPGLITKVRTGLPPGEVDATLIAKLERLNIYQQRVLPSLSRPDGLTPATGSGNIWTEYGKSKPLKPPSTAFTSILFPHGGYAIQRDGWKPDSLYLFMKAARPNAGHWRPMEAGLQLSAYGRNLLVSPVGNLYDSRDAQGGWRLYWESAIGQNTIVVDGMSASERKGDFNRLDPMRWHVSPRFDFMETEVTGPYTGADPRSAGRAYAERKNRGEIKDGSPITDVVHRRQVHFLREAGLWIVTDRIRSATPHEFTQSWSYGPEYAEGEIVPDAAGKTIRTRQPNAPNLSLYQFGIPALEYRKYYGVYSDDSILGWVGIMTDSSKWTYTPAVSVHANWRGEGEQILVTLLCPRRKGVELVTKIQDRSSKGVAGFDAELNDQRRISYRCAVDVTSLKADGMETDAASLLVLADATGRKSGVVLDARSFSDKPPQVSNFEFDMSRSAEPAFTPIHVPLGFRWAGTPETPEPEYTAGP